MSGMNTFSRRRRFWALGTLYRIALLMAAAALHSRATVAEETPTGHAGAAPPAAAATAQDAGETAASDATTVVSTDPVEQFLQNPNLRPFDVERFALVLLNLGLVGDVERLMAQYFSPAGPLPNANVPIADAARRHSLSPIAAILWAEAILLRYKLSENSLLNGFQDPLELHREKAITLVLAEEKHELGRQALERVRAELSGSQYANLRSKLLVLHARIKLAQGDALYRLRGASLTAQSTGPRPQAVAAVDYSGARQSLFEAVMLSDNLEVKSLALDVEARFDWLARGQFFGGLLFFEVDPVQFGRPDTANQEDVGTVLGRLRSLLHVRIPALTELRQKKLLDARLNSLEIGRRLQQRAQDVQHRRNELIGDVLNEYRRIEGQLKTLAVNDATADLQDARNLVSQELQSSELREAVRARQDALKRRQTDIGAELARTLHELSQAASKETLKKTGEDREDPIKEIEELVNKLNQLKQQPSLKSVSVALRAFETTTASMLDRADQTIKQVNARIDQVKQNLSSARIEESKQQVENARVKLLAELQQGENKAKEFLREMKTTEYMTKGQLANLEQRISDSLRQELAQKKAAIQLEINKVKGLVAHAEGFLRDIKSASENAEKAILAARAAMIAAGQIPSGIISGLANGVITERPSSMIAAAKAGADLVTHALATIEKVEDARDRIDALSRSLREYEDALNKVNADSFRQGIEGEIQRLNVGKDKLIAEIERRLNDERRRMEQKAEEVARAAERIVEMNGQLLASKKRELEAVLDQNQIELTIQKSDRSRLRQHALFLAARVDELTNALKSVTDELNDLDANLAEQAKREKESQVSIASSDANQDQANKDAVRLLSTQLEAVARRLQELRKAPPEPLTIPVDELTARVGEVSVTGLTEEIDRQLIKANRLLFHYANWMYLLTRNPEALKWAVSCENLGEARLAYERLNELYTGLRAGVGAGRIQTVSLMLDAKTLNQCFPKLKEEGVAYFRVAPQLADVLRSPVASLVEWERVTDEVGTRDRYRPNVMHDTIVFAPHVAVQPRSHEVLVDAFAIPTWNDQKSIPLDLAKIGLEPIGPTEYLVEGRKVDQIPVRFPEQVSVENCVMSLFEVAQNLRSIDRYPPDRSRLEGVSPPSFNTPAALGRGMGNSWRIELPHSWSNRQLDAPPASRLESIEVILAFASSPRLTGRATPVEPRRGPADASIATVPAQSAENYAQELLSSYRLDQQAFGNSQLAFQRSPIGRVNRLKMLELAMLDLPRSFDLIPSKTPLEDKARPKLPDSLFCELLAASQSLGESNANVELRCLIKEAVDRLFAGDYQAPSLDKPGSVTAMVDANSAWIKVQSTLGPGNNSLLSDLEVKRESLKETVMTLEEIAEDVGLWERFAQRLRFDREVGESQRGFLRQAEQQLNGRVAPSEDNKKRLVQLHRWFSIYREPIDGLFHQSEDDPELIKDLELIGAHDKLNELQREIDKKVFP